MKLMGSFIQNFCAYPYRVLTLCALVLLGQSASAEATSFTEYRHILSQCFLHEEGDADGTAEDIYQSIIDAQLYSDTSSLGVVFQIAVSQHCEYTLASIPSFSLADVKPVRAATDVDWQELATLDRGLYVALYASYLSFGPLSQPDVTAAQKTAQRMDALRKLKTRLLQSAELMATAIASVHLAMVLSEVDPVAAIDEFRYALPHLPVYDKQNVIMTYYDQTFAHQTLGVLYAEIGFWQRVEYHAEQQDLLTNDDDVSPASFTNRINANIALQRYDKAAELVRLSRQSINKDVPWHTLWLLRQEITLMLYRNGDHVKERILQLVAQAKQLPLTDAYDRLVLNSIELTGSAISGSDTQFNQAIKRYERAQKEYAQTNASRESELYTYKLFSKLYALRGQYQQAYQYDVRYQQNKIRLNEIKHAMPVSKQESALAYDAEFMSLQRAKNDGEKQALELQASKLRVALSGVIILFLLAVSFWFWRNQRKAKHLANTDTLTGALSRRVCITFWRKPNLSDAPLAWR